MAKNLKLANETVNAQADALARKLDNAVGMVIDSAWSAAPTFTTTGPFLRAATLPVTAGSGIVWTFAQEALGGLLLPVSAGICIANLVASGATLGQFSFYAIWDE